MREAPRLLAAAKEAMRQGRFHEFVPFAGQTAGAIDDVLPAGEIVRRIMAEAEAAWERTNALFLAAPARR